MDGTSTRGRIQVGVRPALTVLGFLAERSELACGWCVGKPNEASEQARGVTEVGLIPAISTRKCYGVLGRHLQLTRVGRTGMCAFDFVKCRVASVAVNESIEKGFSIVQDVHVR